jgi:dihydroorotate dehydrogenase electron transfer subunit
MNSLEAKFYADRAVSVCAPILENERLARDTFRVRIAAPEIARRILPGQFVMLRLAGWNDPLIGRPLALFDVALDDHGEPTALDVVYLVKGKFTRRLSTLAAGQQVEIWGPLGNGFVPPESAGHGPVPTEHLIMVAGGIGYTPFLALAKEALHQRFYGFPPRLAPRALHLTFCYGARTADYLVDVEPFTRLGVDVRIATDDGSRGHHGLVTDLLRSALAEQHGRPRIVCCGPEPMMEAVAEIAREKQVPCQVSLETPMACGIGICFTCVAKVRQSDGTWDYKRTCVDGPVFEAEAIEW